MRPLLLPVLTAGLLTFSSCTPATPEGERPASLPASQSAAPSTGPSPSASPTANATATASATASEDPDDGSVEEQGDDSGDKMTRFSHAYTYRDGVEVEVTKIRHGTVTAEDVNAGARLKKGTPWVQLTVRVTNGSKQRLTELVGDYEFSYGPDKDVADPVAVPGVHNRGLSGGIARGGSKVASSTFSVPVRDQDDVVLGFTPDLDHSTAYFSGSVA